MKTKLNEFLRNLLSISSLLCIIGVHQLCGQQKTMSSNSQKEVIKKVERLAIVTDTKGKQYDVSNMVAVYYLPNNFRFLDGGTPPPKMIKSIGIRLGTREDRIWTHDQYYFPFDSIFKIEIKSSILRIEKIDSTVITRFWDTNLNKNVFEITESKGSKKRIECNEIHNIAGDLQGQGYFLRLFEGKAKTVSGKEGDFSISIDEVSQIVFRK